MSGLLFSNSIHIPLYLFFSFYLLFSILVLAAAWPQESEPNRILLVTIHHMIYPITVEVLHQVFKAYGFVEKIVTFQKSAGQIFLLSLISFTTHTYTCYTFSDSLIDCMWMVRWLYQFIWALYVLNVGPLSCILFQKVRCKQQLLTTNNIMCCT